MWRTLLNGLPTDDNIRRLGIPFPSQCRCCRDSEETLNHTLFQGKWAKDLWHFIHRFLGWHTPSNLTSFKSSWLANLNPKNYFHCFCIGLACCGLWEVWNKRNATIHEDKDSNLSDKMLLWTSKLAKFIPAGPMTRREQFALDHLNVKSLYVQKPSWVKWNPPSEGNCLHIAVISVDNQCKGSALFRDHNGVFIRALVLHIEKSSPASEYIQCVKVALQSAQRLNFSIRHIYSSHDGSFNFDRNNDKDVPWENLYEVRSLDTDYGPMYFHRITAGANNAALCLTYTSPAPFESSSLAALPLQVKRCIRADHLGLATFCDDHTASHPTSMQTLDDTHQPSRRGINLSDDMGLYSPLV